MNPRYKFFEIVKIVSTDIALSNIVGKTGIVLGRSQDDIGEWAYAVSIHSRTWALEEAELEATGRFSSSENIYTGESLKVGVKPDGTGYLKDQTDG